MDSVALLVGFEPKFVFRKITKPGFFTQPIKTADVSLLSGHIKVNISPGKPAMSPHAAVEGSRNPSHR